MTPPSYSIAEAARATGLSQHALRYYERIGLVGPIARLPNGRRRYSDDDLWWLGFVALTAGTGMPIRRIREFVDLERAGGSPEAKLELLERERSRLLRDVARLRANLATIDRKVAYYRGRGAPSGG